MVPPLLVPFCAMLLVSIWWWRRREKIRKGKVEKNKKSGQKGREKKVTSPNHDERLRLILAPFYVSVTGSPSPSLSLISYTNSLVFLLCSLLLELILGIADIPKTIETRVCAAADSSLFDAAHKEVVLFLGKDLDDKGKQSPGDNHLIVECLTDLPLLSEQLGFSSSWCLQAKSLKSFLLLLPLLLLSN